MKKEKDKSKITETLKEKVSKTPSYLLNKDDEEVKKTAEEIDKLTYEIIETIGVIKMLVLNGKKN